MDGRTIVVMPAYNAGKTLEKTHAGVIAQDCVDNVIVVDDGSSDDTARTAEEAGALVIVHEQNQGKAQAINTGLQRAREMDAASVILLCMYAGLFVALW